MKRNTPFTLLYKQLWLADINKVKKINPLLNVEPRIYEKNDEDKMRERVAILMTEKLENTQQNIVAEVKPTLYAKDREVPALLKTATNDSSIQNIDTKPPIITNWDTLTKNINACTKCSLNEGRKHAVIERGNRSAKWMFIGEAPSDTENNAGVPFVGQAGELLNKMIQAMNLDVEVDTYICHVVKCSPLGAKHPSSSEIAMCNNYLLSQIELVKPQIIVTLGMFASQSILGTNLAINNLRGKVHMFKEIPVIVTYDPSYLLRNTGAKKYAWEDLQLAMKVAKDNENKN